jgi:hypothetical protein
MVTALVGFLLTLFFATLVVLSINYAIYLWESRRIDDLTKNIKPQGVTDPLQQPSAHRGFTTRDVGGVAAGKFQHLGSPQISANSAIQKIDTGNRYVMGTETDATPSWYRTLLRLINNIRFQFWPQLRRWFKSVKQLFQPVHHQDEGELGGVFEPEVITSQSSTEDVDAQDEQAEISDLVEKVINQNQTRQIIQTNPKQTTTQTDTAKDVDAGKAEQEEKDKADQKVLFEKLESRLLSKLQEVGLRHFDVWLELGKLYEKHQQPEKASEIYTMILKNSQGSEKDQARDRLISLN